MISATSPRLGHFSGGQWIASDSERFIRDVNPSDATDLVAEVPEGTPDEAAAVVDAAAAALPRWRALSGPARAELLYTWAQVIQGRAEELAQLMTREVGKPIGESRGEAARCVAILRYYAGEAVRQSGDVIPAQSAHSLQYTRREPLGVVALITPWNFPLAIPLWKAAPALAFGNTVVLKAAEASSRCAAALADTAAQAGIPAGVFNVLFGDGAIMGPALMRQEAVKAVSFTGSGRVGAIVGAAAASRNIRYQTEMGGKNVAIVLPDADLALAASLTAAGALRFAGQKCTATSRVIVDAAIEEAFVERLVAEARKFKLGPVTDADAAVGPVISGASRDAVRTALALADAECVYAGEVPRSAEFANGYFAPPTIVRGVTRDADIARRELFAPVLAVFPVAGLDEAIELANDTNYGLSASLFTRDVKNALQYIERMEAGMVRVNGDTTGVDPHAPFGGMKGSSSGSREQGPAAREFYTHIKTVQINP
jgi:aldehyde dehydrogenase (NAD+)